MTTKLLEFAPKGRKSFGAPSSQERKPLFQPMRVNPDSERIATAQKRRLWQVPDAVNESGCGAPNSDSRPWKVRFLIFAGLLCFVWYQVAKQLGWLN